MLEYFCNEYKIILNQYTDIINRVNTYYEANRLKYTELLEMNEVLPLQWEIFLDESYFIDKLNKHSVIYLDEFLSKHINNKDIKLIDLQNVENINYFNQINEFIDTIKNYLSRDYRVVFFDNGITISDSLKKELFNNGINYSIKKTINEVDNREMCIISAYMKKGYVNNYTKLAVFTYSDVFGKNKQKVTHKHKNTIKIEDFKDIKIDDYVVHEDYGVGVYKGISKEVVNNIPKDFLKLQYKGSDRLYVSIDQLDKIQIYKHSDAEKVKVHKLGGKEWTNAKEKVKKSLLVLAKELIELRAKRELMQSYSYPQDDILQQDFESSFEYTETDDQLKCAEEIKKDLEKSRPMDRLLCGDVGFGKTEVATRAIFKVVKESKQVALLVPTTVLAQQHYKNLTKRFKKYPVKIGVLSRFRTKKQQDETIKLLKLGEIDLIIGTHRLLSEDIEFNDLGLLIIDEEQRFGVRHKEKILNLKENIDVLTLTATPIPRTLHMSMIGLRDISIIEDPPENRFPVQTYVMEYNKSVVKEAILKEYNRNGQVFVVYNKVKSIHKIKEEIIGLLPELNIEIAHGQMSSRELENIMINFFNGTIDVLISTTIIETGMDVPNANTMIVIDADHFGLSQLYQLRGRIGRSDKLSYCYLTYRKDKVLSEIAKKRLSAIKDFVELGSGYKISMKDLEIRGAGNLLGAEQSGHIGQIGYELYTKLLKHTIKKMKKKDFYIPQLCNINLNIPATMDMNYIQNEKERLEVYKKIGSIHSAEDYNLLIIELEDRFGIVPVQMMNLLKISLLRAFGEKLGVKDLFESNGVLTLKLHSKNNLKSDIIKILVEKYDNNISFTGNNDTPTILFKLKRNQSDNIDLDKILEIFYCIEEKLNEND